MSGSKARLKKFGFRVTMLSKLSCSCCKQRAITRSIRITRSLCSVGSLYTVGSCHIIGSFPFPLRLPLTYGFLSSILAASAFTGLAGALVLSIVIQVPHYDGSLSKASFNNCEKYERLNSIIPTANIVTIIPFHTAELLKGLDTFQI